MHLYTLAVSPVPPPPDFWGEVNRLAGWLLPTATAWVVSVAISLWLWFKFLRDQFRRARGAGQAAIGFLDKAQGTRAAALVSAAVGILQLTWLFLTWIFAMMVTWILHLERQVDTLQWNGWTATYLLACACVLGSSYAVAFGLAGRGYRNARSRYDREYLIYYRLCWVPVALPAVIAALGAVFLLIGGLARMEGIPAPVYKRAEVHHTE